MRVRRGVGLLAIVAMLAGCGGGDGGSGSIAAGSGSSGTGGGTTGTVSSGQDCSLRARQNWVAAAMNEWYLFPDTLPTNLDPSGFSNLSDYVDALTANARAQRKDRYFTYVTSVKEENAYYSSGATAGLGVRLAYDSSNRLIVSEAFEGAPALAAGIDRGAQIVAIGSSATTIRNVSDMSSAELDSVLDTSTPGTTRVIRITDANGTRDVTVSSANYSVSPLSSRYGSKVIVDNGTNIGYINLRTFIDSADGQLRDAIGRFRAQGITQVIVDLRYNGGGLLSTAKTFSNLLAATRSTADVQSYVTYRPSKSSQNETNFFGGEANAIAPMKIAFIGTGQTASASEYVINALLPYMHSNIALIGSNTYGKPVGQIALDNPACSDDRLRVISFALQNAARQGDYYDGLATKMEATCQARDDFSQPMGDPSEGSTRTALDWLAGRGCTPIGASASATRVAGLMVPGQRLLQAARPNAAQRETPGLF